MFCQPEHHSILTCSPPRSDTIEANVKELQKTHSQQAGGGGEEGQQKARPPPARDIVGMAAAAEAAEAAAWGQ